KEAGFLGMDLPASDGWHPNRGLRLIGGGHRLELDWPDIDGTPNYGLTRPRLGMDEAFARHAQRSGARLFEQVKAMSPDHGADGSDPRPISVLLSSSPPTGSRPGWPWPWGWRSATTGPWASPPAPTTPRRGTPTTTSNPGSRCARRTRTGSRRSCPATGGSSP